MFNTKKIFINYKRYPSCDEEMLALNVDHRELEAPEHEYCI